MTADSRNQPANLLPTVLQMADVTRRVQREPIERLSQRQAVETSRSKRPEVHPAHITIRGYALPEGFLPGYLGCFGHLPRNSGEHFFAARDQVSHSEMGLAEEFVDVLELHERLPVLMILDETQDAVFHRIISTPSSGGDVSRGIPPAAAWASLRSKGAQAQVPWF